MNYIRARPGELTRSKNNSVAVVVPIMIAIMVVIMAPVPITFLIFLGQMTVVATSIHVVLGHPLVVIDSFVRVPTVIIVVIRIVITVRTTRSKQCQTNNGGRGKTSSPAEARSHVYSLEIKQE